MSGDKSKLADAFLMGCELHSVERLRACLDAGMDVQAPLRAKLPIEWLLEMYTRSDQFPECLSLLLERGAILADPVLEPVLLDDGDRLRRAIEADPALLTRRTSLVSCFTPLLGASLLHVAAEYGNWNAARVLVELGADVNARAAVDDFGLNGHTPLFHTVNSNANRSEPIMVMLLQACADVTVRLPGLVWGKGFEWETTFFDLTPISYAQMGLLPQVQRCENAIYANIRQLLDAAGRPVPPLDNIPNRYLFS